MYSFFSMKIYKIYAVNGLEGSLLYYTEIAIIKYLSNELDLLESEIIETINVCKNWNVQSNMFARYLHGNDGNFLCKHMDAIQFSSLQLLYNS